MRVQHTKWGLVNVKWGCDRRNEDGLMLNDGATDVIKMD